MTVTRSQKIFIGVLVVALLALAVDQLLLGGEGTGTPAASQAVESYSLTPSEPLSLPEQSQTSPEAVFARRLWELTRREALDPEQVVNIFNAPEAWQERSRPEGAAPPAAEAFRQSHQLTSVLLNSDGGTATVNNQVLQVGDEIGGFRLVEVRPGGAVFQSDSDRVELGFSKSQ